MVLLSLSPQPGVSHPVCNARNNRPLWRPGVKGGEAPRTYLSDIDWLTAVNGFQSIGIDKRNGGVKQFDSGPMYGSSGPTTMIEEIDLDVTGVETLVLKMLDINGSYSGDHGV